MCRVFTAALLLASAIKPCLAEPTIELRPDMTLSQLLELGTQESDRSLEAAIYIFKRGLRQAEMNGNMQFQVIFSDGIASRLATESRFSDARPYAERALKLARQTGHRQGEAASLMELCTINGHIS